MKHGPLLAYAKLNEIWKKNITVYKELKKNQTITELFSEGRFGWDNLKIDFNLLNIEALSSQVTQNDFRILNVAQCDLLIAEKEVERENVIQITFASMAILWDLDQHKEVTFISK